MKVVYSTKYRANKAAKIAGKKVRIIKEGEFSGWWELF